MSPILTTETPTLLAIVVMASATILTRQAGLLLVRHRAIGPRVMGILDAIPPAVLMAVIAPTAFATGTAETAATIVTALAATRLPLLAAVASGVISVALLRAAGV